MKKLINTLKSLDLEILLTIAFAFGLLVAGQQTPSNVRKYCTSEGTVVYHNLQKFPADETYK